MPEEPRLARDILRCFIRNTGMADDLEGIARWRLLEEAIYHRVDETAQALEWLVEHDLLRRDSTTASGTLFRLDDEARHRAETFLQEGQHERE
jgi:hypothetical protein